MPEYLTTTKQKLTAGVLVIILLILIWQIYDLFFSSGSNSAPQNNLPAKPQVKENMAPPHVISLQPPVKPLTTASALNPNNMSPSQNLPSADESSMDPTQKKYLRLLQEYKLLELQKSIAADKQAIVNAQLATMEAVNKLNSMGGQAQVMSLLSDNEDESSATPSEKTDKKFSLQYTGLEDGEWVATVKYGDNAYDVKIGTVVAKKYKVTRINNDGVTLSSTDQIVELSFDDAQIIPKTDLKSVTSSSQTSVAQTSLSPPVQATAPILTPVKTAPVASSPVPIVKPSVNALPPPSPPKITPAQGSVALAKNENAYMHNPAVARATVATTTIKVVEKKVPAPVAPPVQVIKAVEKKPAPVVKNVEVKKSIVVIQAPKPTVAVVTSSPKPTPPASAATAVTSSNKNSAPTPSTETRPLLLAQQSDVMNAQNASVASDANTSSDDLNMPMIETDETLAPTPTATVSKPKTSSVQSSAISSTKSSKAKAPPETPLASSVSAAVFNQSKQVAKNTSASTDADVSYWTRFKNWMRGDEADALPTKN